MSSLPTFSSPQDLGISGKWDGTKANYLMNWLIRTRAAHAYAITTGSSVIAYDRDGNILSNGTAGTDDKTVIQAAINDLTAGRTRQEKVLAIGNFVNNGVLTVPSYTDFELAGRMTLKAASNSRMMTLTTTSDDIYIHGGFWDGNKANNTNDSGDGTMTAIYGSAQTNLWLKDIHFLNPIQNAVYISNSGWNHWENLFCNGSGATTFEVDAVNYIDVINCRSVNSALHGTEVVGGGTRIDNTCNIIGGRAYGADGYGLRVIHATGTKVTGFTARHCGEGGSATHGIIVNDCANVDLTACKAMESYDSGLFIVSSEFVTVNGGSYYNNGLTGTNATGITLSSVTDSTITGATCTDNQTPKTQDYGFYEVGAGCARNVLVGVQLTGNASSAIRAKVSAALVRCPGYTTENTVLSDTFAIDSTGIKTVTITHALSGTPAKEDCMLTVCEDSNVDDWAYNLLKVDATSSTTVTAKINVSTASGTGGATAKLGLLACIV